MARNLLKNKKGSGLDIAYIGVILLAIALTVLITYTIWGEINNELQADSKIPAQGKTTSNQIEELYPNIIDNSFMFLMIGLAIIAFFMASMVRVHPVFIVFYFIILAVIILLGAVFSNIYQEIAADATFAPYSANLTFITLILNYLPIIVGIFGTILAVVMYKAWSEGQ